MAPRDRHVWLHRISRAPTRRGAALAVALALALPLATGCAASRTLVAADGERRLIARDQASGVSVVLTLGAWDGDPPGLAQELTVVHVLVANMGTAPVRIAPGDFELVDERGFAYDVFDTGGSFQVVDTAAGGAAGGGAVTVRVGRGYPNGRSDRVRSFQVGGDVAAAALPWGYLQPGTQVRGYVYFERLEDSAHRGRLVWHLAREGDQPLADLQFELFVARG
jgi:hypothetical protein